MNVNIKLFGSGVYFDWVTRMCPRVSHLLPAQLSRGLEPSTQLVLVHASRGSAHFHAFAWRIYTHLEAAAPRISMQSKAAVPRISMNLEATRSHAFRGPVYSHEIRNRCFLVLVQKLQEIDSSCTLWMICIWFHCNLCTCWWPSTVEYWHIDCMAFYANQIGLKSNDRPGSSRTVAWTCVCGDTISFCYTLISQSFNKNQAPFQTYKHVICVLHDCGVSIIRTNIWANGLYKQYLVLPVIANTSVTLRWDLQFWSTL